MSDRYIYVLEPIGRWAAQRWMQKFSDASPSVDLMYNLHSFASLLNVIILHIIYCLNLFVRFFLFTVTGIFCL